MRKTEGVATRAIGSRVDLVAAERDGCNFLAPEIVEAVKARIEDKQAHQTLGEDRLWCDLLSSMPMCFNLFGPLWSNPSLATAVTNRWFPDLCSPDAEVTVGFEWSPGRRLPELLGDRTAFDAVLHIVDRGIRRLIGIETKYHEYPKAELVTSTRKGKQLTRAPNPRYLEVTRDANLFEDTDWLGQIWGAPVEQVWRDHLLALACQQHPDWPDEVRYVLVAPTANPAWKPLAAAYSAMLTESASPSFEYRSVDALIEATADLLPHAAAFRHRYLDVDLPTVSGPTALGPPARKSRPTQ